MPRTRAEFDSPYPHRVNEVKPVRVQHANLFACAENRTPERCEASLPNSEAVPSPRRATASREARAISVPAYLVLITLRAPAVGAALPHLLENPRFSTLAHARCSPTQETLVSRPLPMSVALASQVLPPGFEPGIAVPKTAVISVSPRERGDHDTLRHTSATTRHPFFATDDNDF